MQFLIEVMAAIVVWAAALAFNQFGVEVDLTRPAAQERPTVQRTPKTAAAPAKETANEDCPDAKKAEIHRI